MYLILILTLLFATPSYAQDIPQGTVEKRIQQLEQEKSQLEAIYKEIVVRIDELKQLIVPKENKHDETEEVK